METLREMFPNRGETALRQALESSNGDVGVAAERLLPPNSQILRDEALARSLQAAEMPPPSAGNMRNANNDTWASVTQPVLDGIVAAADAAKAMVSYVATEISAAASAVGPVLGEDPSPSRTRERMNDDTRVVTGGASRANDPNIQLRDRSARANSTRGSAGGGSKED